MALTRTLYGKLSDEDLARVRMADAKRRAMEIRPQAYGRDEIEQMYVKYFQLHGEMAERYGVPDTEDFTIDCWVGVLHRVED